MKVAITSPSFSKHPVLIKKVQELFPNHKLNTEGNRFNQSQLIDYLKGFDAAIVGLDEINSDVLDALPELKIISKYGVGLNNIDLDACKKRQVEIGWTGGVNRLSVAEMTLGNILALSRNIYQTSTLLSNGEWKKDGGFQLSGKKVGIIGVGHIGKEVVRLLKPFNCQIFVNDVVEQNEYYNSNNLTEVDKETIIKTCDVITIHTPLTNDTKNLINKSSLSQMKDGAVIINTARGGIVNETDLKNELKTGRISAAIDVYENEPPSDLELLSLPNLICTPHIGGNAKEAVELMGLSAIEHLKKFYNL